MALTESEIFVPLNCHITKGVVSARIDAFFYFYWLNYNRAHLGPSVLPPGYQPPFNMLVLKKNLQAGQILHRPVLFVVEVVQIAGSGSNALMPH